MQIDSYYNAERYLRIVFLVRYDKNLKVDKNFVKNLKVDKNDSNSNTTQRQVL